MVSSDQNGVARAGVRDYPGPWALLPDPRSAYRRTVTATSTKVYRPGPARSVVDHVYGALTRHRLGASYRHLLTVTGRTSGLPRTTPVDVMTHDGKKWLVAPYGEVNWVKNLRRSGRAELRRGRTVRTYDAVEVGPEAAAPVIRQYIARVPVTRAIGACRPGPGWTSCARRRSTTRSSG